MNRLTPEAVNQRLAAIKDLRSKGLNQQEIGNRLGLTQPAVSAFMRRHGLKGRASGAYLAKLRPRNWGEETADPSNLTQEQLDTARRTGITPERFAWLCSCQRIGTRVGEHRGGNSIG